MEKARRLMRENKIGALFMQAGTSMYYFTGKRANGTSWVLPARGEPIWIEPGAGFGPVAQAFIDCEDRGQPYVSQVALA